ncbi:hypothetical protein [Erythrobacter mangrovi]|uniref:Aminotransferase class I/II-fold pyridoxal phosphate-dependent enzyme n=1 Tax=Erythrobacter mangrovi TaxID=2739433 RepID=A0A7D4B789_9SPHN|nr:hypothetical protein [Erythrobacter mangrovi]QKG70963.1 hypothetical protein HQR01_06025 [Erythrobacter mangrovi]
MSDHLPSYSQGDVKQALFAAGASGTIYSLVMPESEAMLAAVMDGGTAGREAGLFDHYREAWTQKQDTLHESYFERWIAWSSPVVKFDATAFPHHYPTAGASEGIFKLMAEYAASAQRRGFEPSIHIFDGEYEGFSAYAASLGLPLRRHARSDWQAVSEFADRHAQFWISQPSAIDGAVWPHFDAFARELAEMRPDIALVPDLTYVGNVARAFEVAIDLPNVAHFVFSHSKPFGGYYHRVGGVFAREECPSLVGNKWFKNLLSLAWGSAMMDHFSVHELPSRYAEAQAEAARRIGHCLGIAALAPAQVNLLVTAPASAGDAPFIQAVHRGCEDERIIRICATPSMAALIDPKLAASTAPRLLARWQAEGLT